MKDAAAGSPPSNHRAGWVTLKAIQSVVSTGPAELPFSSTLNALEVETRYWMGAEALSAAASIPSSVTGTGRVMTLVSNVLVSTLPSTPLAK